MVFFVLRQALACEVKHTDVKFDQVGRFALEEEREEDVRFESEADICGAKPYVRFTPKSGHVQRTSSCLLWAKCTRNRHGERNVRYWQ